MKNMMRFLVVGSIGLVAANLQATPILFEALDFNPDNPTSTASHVGDALGETLTHYFRWSGEGDSNAYITVAPGEKGIATVTWDLTGTGLELEGIYCKGGSNGGNIYDISDSASDFEEIKGSGTINTPLTGNNGNGGFAGISHIDFLVGPDPNTIPDGGTTLVLLGSVLSALALVRAKFANAARL